MIELNLPLLITNNVTTITYCEERWFDSFQQGRLVYSVFTFLVQVRQCNFPTKVRQFTNMFFSSSFCPSR